MIRVDGLTYWEIKCRALNGHRDRLSDEQLGFVGFEVFDAEQVDRSGTDRHAWAPTGTRNPAIDKKLEELAALLDTMPGWVRLAREIVKDE